MLWFLLFEAPFTFHGVWIVPTHIMHIYRGANQVADSLVDLRCNLRSRSSFSKIADLPRYIQGLVLLDQRDYAILDKSFNWDCLYFLSLLAFVTF